MTTDQKSTEASASELMKLHVEALFTHDRNMRLRTINEPWPGEDPAPRFFLGRDLEGTALCRFRYDVPEELVGKLTTLCADEALSGGDFQAKPKHFETYKELLQGERFTMGPCFLIPELPEPNKDVIRITRENQEDVSREGFEWLASEIDYAQPCVALLRDNRAVSVCRSVRITPRAHEAGLETLADFRGKGYAAAVVAGWAMAVRQTGKLPLYSTSWDNLASRSVAGKLGLSLYGVNFTIW